VESVVVVELPSGLVIVVTLVVTVVGVTTRAVDVPAAFTVSTVVSTVEVVVRVEDVEPTIPASVNAAALVRPLRSAAV
jgi:hypothetical protein